MSRLSESVSSFFFARHRGGLFAFIISSFASPSFSVTASITSCNFSTIDTILGYLGYGSIDDFIMDDMNEVAAGLRDQIEEDLQTWDIPAACTPDYELETSELCSDSCSFASDGECDDGGEGSDFAICDYGADCSDCGVRFD